MAYHDREYGGDGDGRQRDARIFVQNFEDLVAHLRPGDPVPGWGAIDGTDATGTVTCIVDGDGAVGRIMIDPGWWDALGPRRVAGAVLDAMRYAKQKAMMARLVVERHDRRPDAATPALVATVEPSEPLPPPGSPDLPYALARKLNRTFAILDEAERLSRERDSRDRRVVAGPRGMFRLILTGQEIVSAEVNEFSLRRSDTDELAADARAALRTAMSAAQPAHRSHGEDR